METFDTILARQPETDFTPRLSADNITEFRERGFTSIGRITTDEEIAWLGDLYDLLFAERTQPVPGGYFDLVRPYDTPGGDLQPQITAPEARFEELRRTVFWRNGRTLAAALLGVEVPALRGWGHMIRKPPRIGGALPWHQDEGYWNPGFDYIALGCWMPLDPATVESGCMSFIPGSHRGEVRVHRHLGDDPTVHALIIDDVDASTAVPVPVDAGGAVFHHCRVVHSSGPNRSARVRRAYANEWQLDPTPRPTPASRPWIDEGKRAWEQRLRMGER